MNNETEIYKAAQKVKYMFGRKVEQERLNKAMYIIRDNIPFKPEYCTTLDTCQCIDHTRRSKIFCKHILARKISQLLGTGCKHDDVIEGICMDCFQEVI